MFKFWKKLNPLVTPKDRAVQEIADQLISWSKYSDRKEILTAVLSRVFPQLTHIHRNPTKKEA